MSKVTDYSLAKLDHMISKAEREDNKIEAHALGLLRKGVEEGVWSVFWSKGEPVFAMPDEDLLEAQRAYREKDEQNQ